MLRTMIPFFIILPAAMYSLISWWCGRSFFARPSHPSRTPENSHPAAAGVTIIKPLKGMDAGSYENFASFCNQRYQGTVQLLFAVASHDDPVIPVVRQLTADFPAMDITLVINPVIHGANYKVSNLINAYAGARHDIIIICDSDIRVAPDYLASVTAHFRDPEVGLVTSLYRTSSVHGIATALEASGFTAEMIPNVLVAERLEGISFALGASMAVRRRALEGIGGFKALADFLADDYQLGNMVFRSGWRIALDRCFVESMVSREQLVSVVSRQLRWARTMRISRPGGYLASGITQPFPAAFLACIFSPTLLSGAVTLSVLYGVRMAVCWYYSRCLVKDGLFPRWLWLLPMRDMTAFLCWAGSFLGNTVVWRGARFRLRPGGKLEELP